MAEVSTSTLNEQSLTYLRSLLGSGELHASELMERTLAEIDRLEPHLAAFIRVDREGALARASAARPGESDAPLAGIPFTVKDTIEVAGMPATAGSLLLADHVPHSSASVVDRLVGAGAIVVGKTNCAEFGIGNLETCSPVRGQTRNPWSAAHSPGGSSGGDSAAIAAGLATVGVGTDYGGSVRFPAHCTGIVALRPTPGRVPLDGQIPQLMADAVPSRPSLVQRELQTPGFLCRSAFDLPLLLSVAAGRALDRPRLASAAWFVDDVDDDVAAAVERAARALESGGVVVERIPAPDVEDAAAVLAERRAAEGLPEIEWLSRGREELLSPLVREQLAQPVRPAAPDLGERIDRWRRWAAEAFDRYDVIAMPVAATPAFAILSEDGTAGPSGATGRPDRSALDRCTRLVTLLSLPAAVVPAGTSSSGLPVGVQLVSASGRDEDAIAAAQLVETALGRWRPRKDIP